MANINDYQALLSIDSIAKECQERQELVRYWLESARCYVAEKDGRVAAYVVLTFHFFGHPFIDMVMVGEEFRQHGLATALIRYVQSLVPGSKLFSSTNQSNVRMQRLFAKLGFKPSGYIDNLDENDPEVIFYCMVPPSDNSMS